MAMRQLPRTGTVGRQVYEDFQPNSEMKEEPDAHVLLIRLPGFTRERVKITYVYSSRIVRVTGESPMENMRWIRFNQAFQVPESCDVEKIHAKFEHGVLTIKMPKKVLMTRVPPPKQEAPTSSTSTSTNAEPEKVKEAASPPRFTSTVIAPPPEPAPEPKQEKIQEATPAKPTATSTSPLLSPQKQGVEEKGPEGSTQKPALPINGDQKEEEVKKEAGVMPPKGQDETPQKRGSTKPVDQKSKEVRAGSLEKLREVKKEAEKAYHAESYLSKKPVEKEMAGQKETKEESKDSALRGLASGHKEGKEIRGAVTDYHRDEGMQQEDMSYTMGKRIKEMSASATEAVTRMAKRKNDEDKQLLTNMGAAILVIAALGAYVNYRIS